MKVCPSSSATKLFHFGYYWISIFWKVEQKQKSQTQKEANSGIKCDKNLNQWILAKELWSNPTLCDISHGQ